MNVGANPGDGSKNAKNAKNAVGATPPDATRETADPECAATFNMGRDGGDSFQLSDPSTNLSKAQIGGNTRLSAPKFADGYKVIRPLKRGGQGATYLVED